MSDASVKTSRESQARAALARSVEESKRLKAEFEQLKAEHARRVDAFNAAFGKSEQRSAALSKALEEESRSREALLLMLEDLGDQRRTIEQARRDWMASVDAIGDPLMVHDADLRILRANRAYAQRAGLKFGELIGRLYWECFPKRDGPLPQCRRTSNGVLGSQEPAPEQEFILDSGETFVSREFASRDETGHLTSALHVFEDITERKRAQEALERSERHYRKLIEGSAEAYFILDQAGTLRYRSDSGKQLTGYETGEVVNRPVTDFVAKESLGIVKKAIAEVVAMPGQLVSAQVRIMRKDGSKVDAEAIGKNLLGDPDVGGIVVTIRDITERKRMEAALHESNQRLIESLENLPVMVCLLAPDYHMPFVNRSFREHFGEPRGRRCFEVLFDSAEPCANCQSFAVLESGEPHRWEWRGPNDRDYDVYDVPFTDPNGSRLVLETVVDITERKRVAQELHDREARLRTILDTVQTGIFIIDPETHRIVEVNPAAARLIGWPQEKVRGELCHKFVCPAEVGKCPITDLGQTVDNSERVLLTVTGAPCPILKSVSKFMFDGRQFLLESFLDITERKSAEEAQRTSSALLNSIIENIPLQVFWKDRDIRYIGCNSPFARDAGYSAPEDLVGKDDFQMGWRKHAELYRADDRHVMDSDTPKLGFEEPLTKPDGREIWIRTSKVPLHATDGKVFGMLGIYEDITERKIAEAALQRLNRSFRTLSACNEALVRANDENGLLHEMVRIVHEVGGYPTAWVGYATDDAQQSIEVKACSDVEEATLNEAQISWGDNERGQQVVGRAIRSGRAQVMNDLENDPEFAPWREDARAYGLGSMCGLPLRFDDAPPFGALVIIDAERTAFDAEEVRLLGELTSDLAYGIANLRAGIERRAGVQRLRRSLEGTIAAIAATLEMRDPYTSGHQRRVAQLAEAIAREMGLSEQSVEGVRFGAQIHDLGKISVPAEILAKPTTLTKVERMLIEGHAQAGYDILKEIEFPWPIASMVLQHHERMDGSGYPNAMKAGDITLEARIVAVADVVEAMSSHRPYRPGLGLDAALKEIAQHKGDHFDPAAVDACLKLFREKNFSFADVVRIGTSAKTAGSTR